MATNYGLTLWDDGDLSPRMHVVSGALKIILALVRRLQRTSGTLWYDRECGTNLADYTHQAIAGAWQVEQAAETECLKEEQVEAVDARAELLDRDRVEMTIRVTPSDGPDFAFVVGINDVTVALIRYTEAA